MHLMALLNSKSAGNVLKIDHGQRAPVDGAPRSARKELGAVAHTLVPTDGQVEEVVGEVDDPKVHGAAPRAATT